MTLRPLADVSPGNWLVDAADLSYTVITRGPAGFESYARILHTSPNPQDHDRREGCLDEDQLAALREVLAAHTAPGQDCFNALWDGFGAIDGGEAANFLTAFTGSYAYGRIFRQARKSAPPPPAFPAEVILGPRLRLPPREYILFAGPLADAGQWGAAPYAIDIPRDINSPNLLWPEDHSWFVATEIDQDWTSVAGSEALIKAVLADPRLEAVRSGDAR